MKNGVFWEVTSCGSCKNRKVYEELSASVIRVTDDGGAKLLRNVGYCKKHMALHPRRRHSSQIEVCGFSDVFPKVIFLFPAAVFGLKYSGGLLVLLRYKSVTSI
jgi:hypothetical protein